MCPCFGGAILVVVLLFSFYSAIDLIVLLCYDRFVCLVCLCLMCLCMVFLLVCFCPVFVPLHVCLCVFGELLLIR